MSNTFISIDSSLPLIPLALILARLIYKRFSNRRRPIEMAAVKRKAKTAPASPRSFSVSTRRLSQSSLALSFLVALFVALGIYARYGGLLAGGTFNAIKAFAIKHGEPAEEPLQAMQGTMARPQAQPNQLIDEVEDTSSEELQSISADQLVMQQRWQVLMGHLYPLAVQLSNTPLEPSLVMRSELQRYYQELLDISDRQSLIKIRLSGISELPAVWKDLEMTIYFTEALNRMNHFERQRSEAPIVFRALRAWLGIGTFDSALSNASRKRSIDAIRAGMAFEILDSHQLRPSSVTVRLANRSQL